MRRILIALIVLLLPSAAFAQGISQLQLWKSTSTPYAAITTSTYGKNLYLPTAWATSTGLAATTICFTSDTCRTSWPTGGSGNTYGWPWTVTTNYGVTVNSTSTPTWYTNGVFASSTSRFVNASTTNLSAVSLCLTGDTCRTTWPSASGGADPFTHTSVFGQTTSATSTLLALTGAPFSLVASSTVNFVNASTTNLTIFSAGFLYLPAVGNYQLLATNGNGAVIATTSIGWGLITGGPAGANPTASVGLSAVNGSATTFMRSDAAPALDQTIAPVMTGAWAFNNAASTTIAKGLYANTIAASYFMATSTATSTLPNISGSGGLSFSYLCLTGDTCRTTWPSGSGDTPGGTGTEIQYRAGASTLGAITSSSFSLTGGWTTFGTTTASLGTLTVGTSTAPQLMLADNLGSNLWALRNINGNLFLATSTATATSTYSAANPNKGFIEFPSSGGCIGCTDLVFGGLNLLNAKYVSATSSSPTLNTFTDIYTVPAGRKAVILQNTFFNPTAGSIVGQEFVKIAGSYYMLNASTTANTRTSSTHTVTFVLEAGESVSIFDSVSGGWWKVNLVEFDAATPLKSVRDLSPTGSFATTTLYTVPTGVSATLCAIGGFNCLPASASSFNISKIDAAGSLTYWSLYLPNGQATADTNTNAINLTAQAVGNSNITFTSGIINALNSGDKIQYALSGTMNAKSLVWITVYEH